MMELLPELKKSYQEKLEDAVRQLRPPPPQVHPEEADEESKEEAPQQQFQFRYPIEDPSEEIKREFLRKIKAMTVTDRPPPAAASDEKS